MFWIVLVIVVIIIPIILFIIYKKYEKFVFEHSISLQKLDEINSKYNFNEIVEYCFTKEYDNENYYEMVSTEDYLIEQLQYEQNQIKKNISLTIENQNLFEEYKEEVEKVSSYGEFDVKPLKISKLLLFIEKRFFNSHIKNPTLDFAVLVVITRTDINGRAFEHKCRSFFIDEIEDLIFRIRDKDGDRFKDKEIWNSLIRVERSKVSNKLRFVVYERDNYQCQKCGRTTDLEVDHIIPISKGGETTLDNLQTLCRSCNLEKSDKIEAKTIKKVKKYNRFCPECGAPLKVVNGKYGEFYGCMNYPRCNYTTRK